MAFSMVAVLTVGALTGGSAAAQSVVERDLKAAYLFNFMQFMEWSRDPLPPRTDVVLCIVDDDVLAATLERTIRGRTVQGHAVSVRILNSGGAIPTCQLLYFASSNLKQSLDAIQLVKDAVVLTVSDTEQFAQMGGMVALFVETGRMRFAVNMEALRRGGVRLSSRLLALAKIVTDDKAGESMRSDMAGMFQWATAQWRKARDVRRLGRGGSDAGDVCLDSGLMRFSNDSGFSGGCSSGAGDSQQFHRQACLSLACAKP
jgi:hypothetical protein